MNNNDEFLRKKKERRIYIFSEGYRKMMTLQNVTGFTSSYAHGICVSNENEDSGKKNL